MPLTGTLEKLYARRRFGIRPGVDRVQFLLDRLGNPERSFLSIHVVGTNGKGSTSAFLSAILTAAGFRTALFTSPHLVSFTERFRINGHELAAERLRILLDQVLLLTPEEATFFEIVTALAALTFAEEGVGIAVVEAGMGGRSDATAALTGIMTVISPIALDHCDYLGDTIAAIAGEKLAIAEPGTPVVSAIQETAAMEVIQTRSLLGGNPLFMAGRDFNVRRESDGTLVYRGMQHCLTGIHPGIPGRYQAGNAACALAAAEVAASLGLPITADNLKEGIGQASWPGRMELVAHTPRVVLDGAHNLAGMAAMIESLGDFSYDRLHVVIGIMQDKAVDAMLALLAPYAACVYAVTPAVERAMPSPLLVEHCRAAGMPVVDAGTVIAGVELAVRRAGPDDLVMACGSLFVVGEVKAHLTGKAFEGIRG